ncbi:MAG: hypothetical protein KBA06_01380 [Saprospiraceae bacterium]|nr:hypothetical protein [Saprospiraceae bacterium]
MNIVSDTNHWMFLSSNGGISAGRKNSEFALFPYYTDDKITESTETTGNKTIIRIKRSKGIELWEPFSIRNINKYNTTNNLYKNKYGNKIIFEEVNLDLNLTFRYEWNNSTKYGFVKKSTIINDSDVAYDISILDGIQNIIPFGIGSELQLRVSNLGDAYKRSELDEVSGLGIFAISANIVDKAEPSESLKANIVFSLETISPKYLLSSIQLQNFRDGFDVIQETDIKGEKGAYFVVQDFEIKSQSKNEWYIIANVNQSQSDVIKLIENIKSDSDLYHKIQTDINIGTQNLKRLVTSADGLQFSSDEIRDSRHFSNTVFNIMRGGVFDDNYQIELKDFKNYLYQANKTLYSSLSALLNELPQVFSLFYLTEVVKKSTNKDFKRLATEYLPLKFSRRHGDPSRPWNKFSINTQSEIDGSKILDYQGNWRDIFQNWEALVHAYPHFIEAIIHKFLNSSTFDGYNPYRITKDGFDWETIEPDDPWSYIGYWGDHQIIYLLKLLEFSEKYFPNSLRNRLDECQFVYAHVPYKIKSYQHILNNPKDTIIFDLESDKNIRHSVAENGADATLLTYNNNNQIIYVNFIEKILATLLSKLSNFVLEGGIWMNTQRPEWNDANNALVGNGLSMVTLYYLRRFITFIKNIIVNSECNGVSISSELLQFYNKIYTAFSANKYLINSKITNTDRKRMLDIFGEAASEYRQHIYTCGFSSDKQQLNFNTFVELCDLSLLFIDHSIAANRRDDALYHAYNLIEISQNEIGISHLDEMLEGQVAVLSSGYLRSSATIQLLDALRKSRLYRADQNSYLLYPNKQLKGFLNKNIISNSNFQSSTLLQKLVTVGNKDIVEKDALGNYRFNSNFKNANDLYDALSSLNIENQPVTYEDRQQILDIFEQVFDHKSFTGRSNTFFGYEGLGSIYWHMVSKLLYAVAEICQKAYESSESDETLHNLIQHYDDIFEGIGIHKSPSVYGAFPTDPYSHTPISRGAQQPGMTGQVKEDILSRNIELGIKMKDGRLFFEPNFLKPELFLKTNRRIEMIDVNGETQQFELYERSLFFTFCQVPIIYEVSDFEKIDIKYTNDNQIRTLLELTLSAADTDSILKRNGNISYIKVFLKKTNLFV